MVMGRVLAYTGVGSLGAGWVPGGFKGIRVGWVLGRQGRLYNRGAGSANHAHTMMKDDL